jgi:hypothetical protein
MLPHARTPAATTFGPCIRLHSYYGTTYVIVFTMLRTQDLPFRATIGEGQYVVWYQVPELSAKFDMGLSLGQYQCLSACVLVGSGHANSCHHTVCFGGIERLQGRTGMSYLNTSALVSICRGQECSSDAQAGLDVAVYPSDHRLFGAVFSCVRNGCFSLLQCLLCCFVELIGQGGNYVEKIMAAYCAAERALPVVLIVRSLLLLESLSLRSFHLSFVTALHRSLFAIPSSDIQHAFSPHYTSAGSSGLLCTTKSL